jgi:hypothetical protein
MTQIVTVNVSQTVAPVPSTLQKTGALLSQGATTTAPGTQTLLRQPSDLTPILKGALSIASLTQTAGVATATTAAPHGFTVSDTLPLTIAGASPAGYNGTFTCTVTGANTFTYAVSNSLVTPATGTIVYTPEDVAELSAMVTTFFAQGSQQAVYVLELGAGNAADGVTYLTTWIAANPGVFYGYLVPRYWASEPTFLTLLGSFETTTSKTYFWIAATTGNYTNFTNAMKSAFVMVETPGIPATEFDSASAFQAALNYAPSTINRVTPFQYNYLYGVTPYPTPGNSTLLSNLLTANTNYVGSGAEGGISTSILRNGTTRDGQPFDYWYSVDWVQINVDLDIANAVINGSNNPANPLYYNQDGINRLQDVAAATMAQGISFGMVLGSVVRTNLDQTTFINNFNNGLYDGLAVVNAVPFITYSKANPGDYAIGRYAGFTIIYTPARGFTSIVFNVNVTNFVAQ